MKTIPLMAAVLVAAGLAPHRSAFAQETPPAQPPPVEIPEEKAPPPQAPPSDYAVGEAPAPVERTFPKKSDKVWKALLAALADANVPVESADEANGYLKTQLIIFEYTRFGDVATPPPIMNLKRPIRQLIKLNQGKFSIEVTLTPQHRKSLMAIRAYIEESAYLASEGRRIWVERWSNGTIEKYIFDRIEKALK
jgi:hypothetical protein